MGPASGEPVDLLVLQAEKVLAQRRSRHLVIDADLLGEPGWDILLTAFIGTSKGRGCRADQLAVDLGLSEQVTARWIEVLRERELLAVNGHLVIVTEKADVRLRTLFRSQLRELMQEISQHIPEARSRS